ncbi:32549_t:CDS:1, partial [Gigaspora margarita]
LLIEFHAYKYREKPYTRIFKKEKESLLKWWLSIDAQKDSLAELAIKIFSIPSSQAIYE